MTIMPSLTPQLAAELALPLALPRAAAKKSRLNRDTFAIPSWKRAIHVLENR